MSQGPIKTKTWSVHRLVKDKYKYKDKDRGCTPIGALALPHFRSSQGPLQKNQARGEEGVLRALYLEKEKKFALPPLCCWDILRGIIFKRAASRRTVAHFL